MKMPFLELKVWHQEQPTCVYMCMCMSMSVYVYVWYVLLCTGSWCTWHVAEHKNLERRSMSDAWTLLQACWCSAAGLLTVPPPPLPPPAFAQELQSWGTTNLRRKDLNVFLIWDEIQWRYHKTHKKLLWLAIDETCWCISSIQGKFMISHCKKNMKCSEISQFIYDKSFPKFRH